MQLIGSAILVLLSIVIFVVPVRTLYKNIEPIKIEREELKAALSNAEEIRVRREELQAHFNNFSPVDVRRLNTLLPDHVDNVRLVIDINEIAENRGMKIQSINVAEGKTEKGEVSEAFDTFNSLQIGFVVTGTYDALIAFLEDLGRSLRIVDIEKLSFAPSDTGVYSFTIVLRTYWLR